MPHTEMFDPFAYHKDVVAHPENYCLVSDIVRAARELQAIKRATTLAKLREAFHGPARAAKQASDDELLEILVEAKNKRKAELEQTTTAYG